MALSLLTIDFWNTLFDSSNGKNRNAARFTIIDQWLKKLGKEKSSVEIEQALQAGWDYFNRAWLGEQRTPPASETALYIWNYLEAPYDAQALQEITQEFCLGILRHPPVLLPGAAQTIKELSQEYVLGIISDTAFSPGIVLRQLMEQNDILHCFSAFSFSDETGYAKPHANAFNSILHSLNIQPWEAAHIGDIEKTDIQGAKALGMKAILFSGDPNSPMLHHRSKETNADIEIFSWMELPEKLHALR
jgi:putative hydrolase of the HAD superfamily